MYGTQVLITYEYDEDMRKHLIDIRTEILGNAEGFTIDFDRRGSAKNFFELYDEENAKTFYEGLIMNLN